jgi:regulator of replication initiation timing
LGSLLKAATDNLSLKAQVDNFAADNSSLKTKVDDLAAEVAQLKANQAKVQELLDKHQAEAESKEKSLQQHLQTTIDSLHGKFIPCLICSIPGYTSMLTMLVSP